MQSVTVVLAGNPNVGKSTLFNALTGMRQHTGNWAGKTVETARGTCARAGTVYRLIDLPGGYSLLARSAEEEAARDALCFSGADAAVVVCDASCLERNLNLALQVLEACPRAVVCVNLMDEAAREGIRPDLAALEARLGVPVAGCAARDGKGLTALLRRVLDAKDGTAIPTRYSDSLERAIAAVEPLVAPYVAGARLSARFVALRLLEGDASMTASLRRHLDLPSGGALDDAVARARGGLSPDAIRDRVVTSIFARSERLCALCVREDGDGARARKRLRMDQWLTGRFTAIPAMLALLALVFFITLWGANAVSGWLSSLFTSMESVLYAALSFLPAWLRSLLCEGVFRVTANVISVMLPPMAIFFPLFTLLEDAGYLPRVAFTLDRRFQRCGACGKQALTMCMGLGCNAVGIAGCRIIDSPRERLLAMLTNAFMPCNGRFPTLILLLSLALPGALLPAAALTALIVFQVALTLLVSRLLSRTLLRGVPSAFTLELPPYRLPQFGRVIARSLLDRTLFVLGRAAAVAAPAGLVIWLLSNLRPDGVSLLARLTAFLDPFARLMGLDGVLLSSFLLGFPANEIVLPLALSGYASAGALGGVPSLSALRPLLSANGWTGATVLCMLVFTLLHWPCSTACWTLRKESGRWRWALAGMLLPTLLGVALCIAISTGWSLLSL